MQHPRDVSDASVNLLTGKLSRMERERHVLINTQMWIEDMRLEDESDIAFCGSFIVNADPVQVDRPFFGFVQACDTPQRRGFSGTRLSEEHEKFLVSDIKGDVVEGGEVAEPFCNVFEFYGCHRGCYNSVFRYCYNIA